MARAGNPRSSLATWVFLLLILPGVGPWAGAGAIAGWMTYKTLKRYTCRPRPFESHPHITAWAPAPDAHSFPSGHTLNAVVMIMAIVSVYPWLAIPGGLWIVAMGLSRVVLGLHYPSDVLAGGIIGSVLGAFAIIAAHSWPITLLAINVSRVVA